MAALTYHNAFDHKCNHVKWFMNPGGKTRGTQGKNQETWYRSSRPLPKSIVVVSKLPRHLITLADHRCILNDKKGGGGKDHTFLALQQGNTTLAAHPSVTIPHLQATIDGEALGQKVMWQLDGTATVWA